MKVLSLAIAGLCAVAFTAAATTPPAAAKTAKTYSKIIVFGDSLSDQGNTAQAFGLPPAPLYSNGRYSDGPNWIDILAQQEGLKVKNSLQPKGTNYAYGFATTGPQNAAPSPLPFTPMTIAAQESAYLSAVHGKANPTALYIIEGGATDILGLLLAAESDPLEILLIPVVDLTAANNIGTETQALLNAGAQHILVSNVPNLGLLPIVVQAPGINGVLAPTLATDAAQEFDYDLSNAVLPLTSGGKVTLWDFYNTTKLVLADASQLGVTNTTTQCVNGFGTDPAATDMCSISDESRHAFFDQVHFTGVGYFGMEQGAYCALGGSNVLNAPQSACVVTQNSTYNGRSGRRIPTNEWQALYRAATQHTNGGR